jgi:hypothetical protein
LQNIDVTFRTWSFRIKARACLGRYSPAGWDTDLFTTAASFVPPSSCQPPCTPSLAGPGVSRGYPVTVGRGSQKGCYGSFDVNYVLWGRLNLLCKDIFVGTLFALLWKVTQYQGAGTPQSQAWTLFGETWPYGSYPSAGDFAGCVPCPASYNMKIAWRVPGTAPSWWPGGWPW